jgi:hypothetical protein
VVRGSEGARAKEELQAIERELDALEHGTL